jgi:Xaa-Pro aminopeptidase
VSPLAARRVAQTRQEMDTRGLPALLVTDRTNVGWLSGFTGSSGFVLLTDRTAVFATDSRYMTQAAYECPGFVLHQLASSAPEEVVAVLLEANAARIAVEADSMTVATHSGLSERLTGQAELVATSRLVADLRMAKDPDEVAIVERACAAVDETFEHIRGFIVPGATEREVMLELEWHMRRHHRAEVAFDSIVASGERSALPHGRASERILQPGDLVTLDYGARIEGYCSDITRTVVLGRASPKQREVYDVVVAALARAIEGVRPGAAGAEVDALARDLIREAGYGEFFGHGLGHSLGRDVHDGPGLAPTSKITLAEGMVLTVEPGIYIPEWGGVRVEQDVVVTQGGCRLLTHATTDLMELPV